MKVLSNIENYEDIADAIREKNGEETLYKPRELAPAIRALSVGTPNALVYKGTLQSASELPESPSDGDLYIVGNETMFWSETDSEWKTVSAVTPGAMAYGGTVGTYAALPSGADVGSVYEVTSDTTSHSAGYYMYNGTTWKQLGARDVAITFAEIEEITGHETEYYPDGDGVSY